MVHFPWFSLLPECRPHSELSLDLPAWSIEVETVALGPHHQGTLLPQVHTKVTGGTLIYAKKKP
jgi:hypothetical protein